MVRVHKKCEDSSSPEEIANVCSSPENEEAETEGALNEQAENDNDTEYEQYLRPRLM